VNHLASVAKRKKEKDEHLAVIIVVEFFRVHVQALKEAKRRIVLRNENNVRADWKVFHVGKRKESEGDDPSCFVFGESEGTVSGPSLAYRVIPLGPALCV